MADLVVTAASVLGGSGATALQGTAGVTITAGQVVYLDAADSLLKLADNNAAGKKTIAGIALHGSLLNQPLRYISGGSNFVPGATVVVGEIYCLSATPGGICPFADVKTSSGSDVSIIGVGASATVISMFLNNTGFATP